MKKINISIIGVGAISDSAHIPGLFSIPRSNIVSVCDIDEKQLGFISKQFAINNTETDYKKILADASVEAVIIATDAPNHAQIVCDSLNAGKHVFVEKPITTSIEDAEKILKLQKETGLSVMVGYQLRFMPNHEKVKELLKKNIIGKPYLGHIRAETLVIKPEESLLIDYGTHFFDLIRWYLDCPKIKSVSGMVLKDAKNVQIGATTNIIFENDLHAVVETYWVPKWNWSNVNRSAEFIGENGKISTQMSIPEIKLWRANSKRDQILGEKIFAPQNASNTYISAGDFAYRRQLEVFVECLLNKSKVPTDAYDGLMALKIADASLKSSEQNRTITDIE